VIDIGVISTFHLSSSKQESFDPVKRPGMDLFLTTLATLYEIVLIDNTVASSEATTIIDKLDPQRNISYRFYRNYYKSAAGLGRELDELVIITTNPDDFSDTPDNVLLIPPYYGGNDATLFALREALIDLVEADANEDLVIDELYRFTHAIPRLRSNNFLEIYAAKLKGDTRRDRHYKKVARGDKVIEKYDEYAPEKKDPLYPRKKL